MIRQALSTAAGCTAPGSTQQAPALAAAELHWESARFEALAPRSLYAVLQLRSEVFVIEQQCLFQDLDGADAKAMHLMGWQGDRLQAYARCFGPGVMFQEASIGRIATRAAVRAGGLGHRLVEHAMALVAMAWGRQPIRIGAQARLRRFYQGHGFEAVGVPYVEDGIDHIEMLWRP